MSARQQLVAAVRTRTEGTPYVFEETPEGFTVRLDLANASWYDLFSKQHLSKTWVYRVQLDEPAKVIRITDDVRQVSWLAGALGGGALVPVLGSVSVQKGRWEEKSFRRVYGFDDSGSDGKVVDYTFDAAEGRDLVRGPARELGWTEKMGTIEKTGAVVGFGVLALLVLAGIVVGIVALAGAFS